MNARTALIWLVALALLLAARPVAAADEPTPEAAALAALTAKGLKKGNSLYLAGEGELKKKLAEENKLKRSLQQSGDTLEAAEQTRAENEEALKLLEGQLILANRNGNAAANNAIIAELKLRESHAKDLAKVESEARSKANEARDDYITFLVEARKLAEHVQEQYQTLAADEEVVAAIAALNKATGKTLATAPTPALKTSLASLKKYEGAMTLEEIPLNKSANTLTVNAVINGKKTPEMVVDSGSSLILLPAKTANALGIPVPSDATTVRLQLADGREIEGKKFKLQSVRVGKFEVQKVDCAVIGPEFAAAEPLLGMSFLAEFVFKIDADAATLTLTKVGEESKGKNSAGKKRVKK